MDADRLELVHPLVVATYNCLLTETSGDVYRFLTAIPRKGFIRVTVAPSRIPRAMKFLDLLCCELECRGYKIVIHQDRYAGSVSAVMIGSSPIPFGVEESLAQLRNLKTEDKPKPQPWIRESDLFPCGRLHLRLFFRRRASDSPGKPIESQINRIISLMENAAYQMVEDERSRGIKDDIKKQTVFESVSRKALQY